ncbi:hypothetical protein EJB05_26824, partial [Eragrostis curvula]
MAPNVPPSSWRPWSDLPLELAYLVLRRLPAHVDRIRFTAVCSHWRAAAGEGPLPPPPPLLALPDGTVYSLPLDEPFRFARSAGYTDACENWLVFSGDGDDKGIVLKDPFSNATLTLPPPSRFRYGPRRVKPKDAKRLSSTNKLKFCSPHLVAAIVKFRGSTRIAVCRPGSYWWSVSMPVDDDTMPLFADIAFHDGKLYALDHNEGFLYSVDFDTDRNTGCPWISRVERVIDSRVRVPSIEGYVYIGRNTVMQTMYLVESRGDLLMVLRGMFGVLKSQVRWGELGVVDVDGRNVFQVFRADLARSRWTRVKTLGDDQVLFLRRRCCRSVRLSPEQMPAGDSIVFIENDDEVRDCYDKESSSSCSVYSMKHGSVSTLLPAVWKRGTRYDLVSGVDDLSRPGYFKFL